MNEVRNNVVLLCLCVLVGLVLYSSGLAHRPISKSPTGDSSVTWEAVYWGATSALAMTVLVLLVGKAVPIIDSVIRGSSSVVARGFAVGLGGLGTLVKVIPGAFDDVIVLILTIIGALVIGKLAGLGKERLRSRNAQLESDES